MSESNEHSNSNNNNDNDNDNDNDNGIQQYLTSDIRHQTPPKSVYDDMQAITLMNIVKGLY